MIHTYELKKGTPIVIGNRTFWLNEDTKIASFTDALSELEICDAMQSMFVEGSDDSIFDLKVQQLRSIDNKAN